MPDGLEEARDPATDPARLAALAATDEPAVLAALAANPNTPLSELLRVGLLHPHQFVENPAFALMLLENPGLIETVDSERIALTLSRFALEALPAPLLQWLATAPSEAILLRLAARSDLDGALIHKLASHTCPSVAEAASLHVDFPGGPRTADWRKVFRSKVALLLGEMPDMHQVKALARAGAIPAELMELLGAEERLAAASSDCVSTAVLERLVQDLDPRVSAFAMVTRPFAPPPATPAQRLQLESLANDPNDSIRRLAALDHSASPGLLDRLASDKDADVRLQTALNPYTPLHALERLLHDHEEPIRRSAASHSVFIREHGLGWFWEMVPFSSPFSRVIAAMHPDLPEEQLTSESLSPLARTLCHRPEPRPSPGYRLRLARDGNRLVRAAARGD